MAEIGCFKALKAFLKAIWSLVCLLPFLNRPCFIISRMNRPSSSVKAWILGVESGAITPNSAASAAGVRRDRAEMLGGFTVRLLDALLTKKYLLVLSR